MTELIEEKINYWKDLWENLISDFLKKSYGLNLYNPHLLVEDIILEIEENNNSEIRKYLKSKLDHYYLNDIVLKKCFQSDFEILRNILHTNKNNVILELCKKLEKKFKKGEYFDENLKLLKEMLFNSTPIDKNFIDRITDVTQNLIVELIKKGYILSEIKKIISKIFDYYQSITSGGEEIITTSFPHCILYKNYTINEKLNRKLLNKDLINLMDGLTYESRIDKLSYYFYKKPEDAHYIFVVEGLKGDINLSLHNVTFYSPENKKFVKEDPQNDEDLQLQKDAKEKYVQVCVKVKYLTPESSLIEALTTVEKAIDLLNCFYNTKDKIEINHSKYIIVQDESIIHSSWSRDKNDKALRLRNSLNLNRYVEYMQELNAYNFIFNEENKTVSKLSNAIHWYSKAEHSSRQEDKILNYWIAIENLFNTEFEILKNDLLDKNARTLRLIQSIISSNQIPSFVYDYGWEVYRYYSDSKHLRHSQLSDEIIEKANLNIKDGETVYLKKFINSLSDIKKVEKNQFWYEKLDNLIKFYKDFPFTIKVIHEQTKLIEEDILMIYRFRNLIVHNAHFDNALLPYYTWKIKEYSGNLIRELLNLLKHDNSSLSNLLINIHLTKEKLLTDLKNNNANLFPDEDYK